MKVEDELSMNDVMNSTFMKSFRKKMLNGELPRSCERCKDTETAGGLSRRQVENDQYSSILNEKIESTGEDGSIEPNIVHADYRLGNSCNLKCRMCNPRASRHWVEQHKKLSPNVQDHLFNRDIDQFLNVNWNKLDSFILDFKSKCRDLERLHFGGGEPLYAPKMKELLKCCIDEGIAKNITLSYNTNLTILPEEILHLWKKFKEVKLLVSIDGVGELNEYIRYPSKWADIDKHLRYLDDNHQSFNITEILVSTTVQVNNVFHLSDLFDYLSTFKFVKKVPNLIMLYFPNYLRVNCLPKKMLYICELKIRELCKSTKVENPDDSYLIKNLEQIRNYFSVRQSEKEQEKRLKNFIQFTMEYDRDKEINLIDVNPEFKHLIKA